MDQETLDFKALRAKFQDEELPLKQPKFKPALPDKPKVVPPPQSPTHYVPAGARPSLLTSINQTLEGKTVGAPRVVFKDEKKEMKKPLIQTNSKGKDKSEGKPKGGKDKTTKESKEKLGEDSLDQKQKKENSKKPLLVFSAPQKENTAELVPATPPPKVITPKKKSLFGLMKSSKRDSAEITADPILDTPSSDVPGPAPLIPVSSDFGNPEPKVSVPEPILPNGPTSSDSNPVMEISPPPTIPDCPYFIPPPAFIPEIPTTEIETPPEIEDSAFPVAIPTSQIGMIPSPSSYAISSPPPPVISPPSPSPPEPGLAVEAGIEAVNIAAVETPPAPVIDPPSVPFSPKAEHPISALSALERAEDMIPEKKRTPVDQRIFSALQKARKKTSSSTNPTRPYSITPPPEEFPPPESPTPNLLDLPPIDYEGAAAPKPPQFNGIDHPSAVLDGITEKGPDTVPELLVVPPPPPQKALPDLESLGPTLEKPARPPSANLSDFIPPPPLPSVEDNGIHAPLEFSENDTTDVPEFDTVASDAHSPELPVTEWGSKEYTGPEVIDGENLPQVYNNGIIVPETEIHAEPAYGDEYQHNPLPESPFPVSQDVPPVAGSQVENGSSAYESADNVYEDVNLSGMKKKGKTDGKKRKGPPKNPYAEAAQETNQEKSKTGRFSKTDKKTAAEGPDEKELKKKEKQRLEKEKKELKEKQEREKKELKEREKKENELKKKFKITGQEDAMYQAKVTVTTKGRKNDLPVKSGDIISIIRTTNCPKGKWLARDSSNNYGYVAVDHVELDIKEMLELGKKARRTSSNVAEPDSTSTGNRVSNHYPLSGESFEDDSEEWTGDEELVSPATEIPDPLAPISQKPGTRTFSMPDMANKDPSINHQHSHSDIGAEGSHTQAKHEALQKLATFFHSPKVVTSAASNTQPETSPVQKTGEAAHVPKATPAQEIDFEDPNMLILPPPDLYADLSME